MSFITIIASKIGIDKAIAYSSGARVIQAVAGVGSIFFISTFLTGVEQGFYYTFGSILALQVFFELGFSGIMTQYVAHEVSHLHLDLNKEYQGEYKYKSRLASLVQFCVKWYSVLAILLFLFLIIVGFVYFNHFGNAQNDYVAWKLPWILISLATSIQLFISPLTSILTGLGFVKETSKISFIQQLFMPLSIWTGLLLGFKLYVTGIGYLVTLCIWLILLFKLDLFRVLKNLWQVDIQEKVSYMSEIFPYQWKIALSWISGYFIFQLFNPVLFATEGAIIAGQMGMTLQALNAISALSLSWLNTKIPLYSQLIARRDYKNLDIIFNRTLKQMISICLFMLSSFFLVIIFLRKTNFAIGGSIIFERFLDYTPMLLMMLPILCNQFISSWATYLRCHKQEPFLVNSIVMGVLCCISTFVLGNKFGLYGIVLGYCCLTLFVSLPWGYYIFNRKKNDWHG